MGLLALALSGLIGISLGLLGGGGSILAVPVLVYVAGVEVQEAIGMSLAIVGATSLIAALLHHRRGNVSLRGAALFGGVGILGAPLGARMSTAVPGVALLASFALLMIVVGAVMIRGGRRAAPPPGAGVRLAPILVTGFLVGVLTGFLGVGGGFLIVPSLVLLARLPMHRAVGTSLLVIALNAGGGLAGHVGHGGLDLAATGAFTAAAAAGALAGERFASRMPAERLRRAFGVFVAVVGTLLLARNAPDVPAALAGRSGGRGALEHAHDRD
jgi:uncharacterized protein